MSEKQVKKYKKVVTKQTLKEQKKIVTSFLSYAKNSPLPVRLKFAFYIIFKLV
jgi:hypothetical protein